MIRWLFPLSLISMMVLTTQTRAQVPMGNPLNGLETLKNFQSQRASSSDENWRNGNADARPIAPGDTLTLADLNGPGVITHIWCTIAHADPYYSNQLTLRMYWDGESRPSVEAPIGDFFGIGHGVDKPFISLPIRVSSDGRARNCYWPMPFGKSARITVTNDSDKPCHAFYFYVDWQKHEQLPRDTAYFHAMYRQEFPCVMGRNYLLADIEGRGHYVGTVQSVYHISAGWYGEGDDFFFIDGAADPQLRGTGTEDYFCDAWGFRQQDGPFYGTPLWEGYNAGDRSSAYRWHIPDPVTFQKSLRAEIEHKGSQSLPDGTVDGFIERDDLMSSVAFWYQAEPHKPWPALPAGKDRVPFHEQTLLVGYKAIPVAKHSEAPLEEQPISGATDGKQLWFRPADDQAWLELPFAVEEDMTAELWVKTLHSWDYGTWRVRLDGDDVGTFDLHNPNITPTPHRIGQHQLSAGAHTLRFELTGKSNASPGYLLGFDALVGRVPVYTRPAGFDLRKIQIPAGK
jgi:hypothetical protein